MSSVNEIRAAFLDYFQRRDHVAVRSSSLVPRDDPSLMFTNAGMVQFKNVFTGAEKRAFPRAASAQKCVRAGGKHNDLDNVGYTARHNTFFEMMGNFSFGDYFKADAIELAWTLITREFRLNKDRLLVTVYHDDDEAFDLWRKIAGLSENRIIRIASADNFWSMGDTGPCGPCSEIFFDQGDALEGGPPGSATQDGDRFLEFWNLVFMQYEQLPDGERRALPRPSIDTGMGLERAASLLQGVHSSFEIDLFRALIAAVADEAHVSPVGANAASCRIIADHLRASAFLVADGVFPLNEGRGYVLRRIMRRAMRHAQLLGAREPLLWRLVPALVAEMGAAYPELVAAQAAIIETLRGEEERFRVTLARGLHLLDDATRELSSGAQLPGSVAFKLYDTYGFPLDLTQDALRPRGIDVDLDGFELAMDRQRTEARKAWTGSGEAATEQVWFAVREKTGATEFLGYEVEQAQGVVSAIVADGSEVEGLTAGARGALVLDRTPFYAESGGQASDTGVLRRGDVVFEVTSVVKKLGDVFIHQGVLISGEITPGILLDAHIDHDRRAAIRANHSATHLLHEALREVLGDHVAQKGSSVAPDRLRFDFANPRPLSEDERSRVEEIANRVVLQNQPVVTRVMPQAEAIASGARALFGERYGDKVRVVAMGNSDRDGDARAFSVELCGGTHVARTGDIGLISIVAEQPVASGVRRIEAKTGSPARLALAGEARALRDIAMTLKAPIETLPERVAGLLEERRKLERELADARRKLAMAEPGAGPRAARTIGDVTFVARVIEGVDVKDLKGLADGARAQIGSGVVAFVGVASDGKAGIVVAVSADLTARVSAVDLVRRAAAALGGKGGGGRPDMAQAGGPDGAQAEAALDAVGAELSDIIAASASA